MSYPNQDDENNTSQEKDSQLKAQKEMIRCQTSFKQCKNGKTRPG